MEGQSLAFFISSGTVVLFLFLFWCALILGTKITNLLDKMFGEKDEVIPLERIYEEKEGGQENEWDINNFNNFL